jgi:glutathione S-transferase
LMPRCAGTKRDGSPCTATVDLPQTHCWWHDPRNSEQRKRSASRAGKSKPSKELARIKARLSGLADDVLSGAVNRSDAAVASQVLNVFLRAVSIETKVREVQELEAELADLRAALAEVRRARGSG